MKHTLSRCFILVAVTMGTSASVDAATRKRVPPPPPPIIRLPPRPLPPPPLIVRPEAASGCFVSPVSYVQSGDRRVKRVSTLEASGDTARIFVEESDAPPGSENAKPADDGRIQVASTETHFKDGSYIPDKRELSDATGATFTDGKTGEVQRFAWIWTKNTPRSRTVSAIRSLPQKTLWRRGDCYPVPPSL